MRRVRAAVLTALVLVALEPRASAADPDPWFAHDKALHAGASATIADLAYVVSTRIFDTRGAALVTAGTFTVALGAAKETVDYTGLGDPSWRDFTWDLIGTAAGLALAWSMDLFVRGTRPTLRQSFPVRF